MASPAFLTPLQSPTSPRLDAQTPATPPTSSLGIAGPILPGSCAAASSALNVAATDETGSSTNVSPDVARTASTVSAAALDDILNSALNDFLSPVAADPRRSQPANQSAPSQRQLLQAAEDSQQQGNIAVESAIRVFKILFNKSLETTEIPPVQMFELALTRLSPDDKTAAKEAAQRCVKATKKLLAASLIQFRSMSENMAKQTSESYTPLQNELEQVTRLLSSEQTAAALRNSLVIFENTIETVGRFEEQVMNQMFATGGPAAALAGGVPDELREVMGSMGIDVGVVNQMLTQFSRGAASQQSAPTTSVSSEALQPVVAPPAPPFDGSNNGGGGGGGVGPSSPGSSMGFIGSRIAKKLVALVSVVGLFAVAYFGKIILPALASKVGREGIFFTTQVVKLSPLVRGLVGCAAVGLAAIQPR